MPEFQEKTEAPTQKKLNAAKKKGEGPDYSELAKAIISFCYLLLLWAFFPLLKERFKLLFIKSFTSLNRQEFSIGELIAPIFFPIAFLLIAFFLLAFFVKKGKKTFTFLFLKILLLGGIFILFLKGIITVTLFNFLFICLFALMILGLIEALYQRWLWKRKMRMTKEELKEEKKESEGNGEIKARLRRK